jgi:hypothetical protein
VTAPSDKEVILAMFTRSGVIFVEEDDGSVSVNVDDQPDNVRKGYHGFNATIYFHADGSLETIGAWE